MSFATSPARPGRSFMSPRSRPPKCMGSHAVSRMSPSHIRFLHGLALAVLLAGALPGAAADKPAPDVPPVGVLLRLGAAGGKDATSGHTERVSAVAFSPDGKLIATGGWDSVV